MFRSIFITLLLLSVTAVAQSNKDIIGFACGEEGSATEYVQKFEKLLRKSNFRLISKLLYSNKSADQFLSVVILEYLYSSQLYTLTQAQKNQIDKIKVSTESIWLCSGCSDFKVYQLNEFFQNSESIIDRTKEWLKYHCRDLNNLK